MEGKGRRTWRGRSMHTDRVISKACVVDVASQLACCYSLQFLQILLNSSLMLFATATTKAATFWVQLLRIQSD